ncbi:MAG: LPS assembly lipoprotein LptE [Deltaproteobacteria bacterium]|nr:LPS assembly lipoprotein LptE [Deltaproteobacteria bacterium]
MKNKFALIIVIFFIPVFISACGFRILNQQKTSININGKYKKYNNISQIFIKPFKNFTYKSGIGVYFSNNLAYYLNTSTDMFTTNKGNARYYLAGKIVSIKNNVMSYTGVAAAVDYMITVVVAISMYKTSGRMIFSNVNISSSAFYYNYINPLIAHKQEKMALKTASKRIARKIAIFIESKRLARDNIKR